MELVLTGKAEQVAKKGTGPKGLVITHKGEEVSFLMNKGPQLKVNGDDKRLYGYALEYLRMHDLEDKFFRIYKEAYEGVYFSASSEKERLKGVKFLLARLLGELPIRDLENFLIEHKDYESFIGSKIKDKIDVIGIGDGEGTLEQTYTRDDYIGLVALAVQQQMLFPVYADLLPNHSTSGNNLEKPPIFMVLKVMMELGMVKEGLPAYRLLAYIKTHLVSLSGGNNDKIVNIASFYRVTDDELPLYILSHVMCKLLPIHQPVCRLSKTEETKDMATSIFGYTKNTMTESDKKTPNKINPSDAYNGEGKDSIFASNQVSTNISQADQAMILVSMQAESKEELVNKLAILFAEYGLIVNDSDIALLNRHRKKTNNFFIVELNIWLMSIFSCVMIPSKFLDILSPVELYNLNSIIYVLVNKLLGPEHAYVYALKFTPPSDTGVAITSSHNIDKEQLKRLEKYYPITNIENNGTNKPVIVIWVSKLRKKLIDYNIKDMLSPQTPTGKLSLTDILVDLLIVSVEKRKEV